MELNKTDILFTALVGSKVAESIPRFDLIQNELSKRVLPPIPFLPVKNSTKINNTQGSFETNLWEADPPTPKDRQFFPFSFVGSDGTKYLLPYEPMITIQGRNTIARRNVAKIKTKEGSLLGGSIKERWTQADYEITITGVLIGSLLTGSVKECYPISDFETLRDFMIAPKSIQVECDPLQLLGINRIVIEDFSFPFTKGENVQAYEIKAYSDFDYKLLLEIND